jgi:hypothetical protein
MRMIEVLPQALTRSRIHLSRFVRVVMPLVIAPALHGCATCGPDHRRTEVEGFLLDRTLTQVARLEVYLSELRNGVNPQLWVRLEDFGNDPFCGGGSPTRGCSALRMTRCSPSRYGLTTDAPASSRPALSFPRRSGSHYGSHQG